jgi:IS4 transposase
MRALLHMRSAVQAYIKISDDKMGDTNVRCWQVELFFKWIKQQLSINNFLDNSENPVKTKLWYVVDTYVLIAVVWKGLQVTVSMYAFLQILLVSVF